MRQAESGSSPDGAARRGGVMRLLTGAPAALVSPLAEDECRRRLSEAMDRPRTMFGEKPVIGRVEGSVLRASKRIPYRNSFQTELTAELTRRDGVTRLNCRFAMNQLVVVLVLFGFGVVSMVFLLTLPNAILGMLTPGTADSVPLPVLAIPAAMLAGMCGIVAIGRAIAASERQFLIDFLCRTVEAQRKCQRECQREYQREYQSE